MNGFVGMFTLPNGEGEWCPNYRVYKKESDLGVPPPVNLWVFVDEQADSINDGFLIDDPGNLSGWGDLPASYHNQACGFSFADGHAEIHKWLVGATCLPVRKADYPGLAVGADTRDRQWFVIRTSALLSSGM